MIGDSDRINVNTLQEWERGIKKFNPQNVCALDHELIPDLFCDGKKVPADFIDRLGIDVATATASETF